MITDTTGTLKRKITSGLFWNLIEKASLHGLKLLVSILLARILEPSQFGIIGMLTLLMAISQSILDSGFGSALIQKKDTTHQDYCTIFYFNLVMGIILTGLLWLLAPSIAEFFNQPDLKNLTKFLSLNIFFNGFGLVQTSIFSKEMKFKSLFLVNFLAALLSGIIGIVLAYRGFGVWSIAFQSVLSTLFTNVFLWVFNSWRPTLVFSMESIKSMFPFGSRLLVSDLISTAFTNLYQTLIGKFYTPSDVGYYSNAGTMVNAILNITSGSMSKVLLPSFSPLQNEIERLKNGYRKAIRYSGFIHFPLMIGLCATVEHLIPLLLTEKWIGSVHILQLLCLVNLLYPMDLLNLNILKVRGRTDLYLKVSIIRKVFEILVILITVRKGIVALLYGQIVNSTIDFFMNGYFTSRMISYSTFDQIKDISPSLLASLLMGTVMYLVRYLGLNNYFLIILIQVIIGLFVYILICLVFEASLVREVKKLLISFVKQSLPSQRGKK